MSAPSLHTFTRADLLVVREACPDRVEVVPAGASVERGCLDDGVHLAADISSLLQVITRLDLLQNHIKIPNHKQF